MKIDVRIMAHPSRRERAERLAERVGAGITWDERDDEWDTAARTWGAIDGLADAGVVLQDDALPIDDFREHLAAALDAAPYPTLISLYVGTGRPLQRRVEHAIRRANHRGAAWLAAPTLYWGPAVVLPVSRIGPMLAWCDDKALPYDSRLGAFCGACMHRPVLYTWPSLVDHDDDEPSLVQSGELPVRKAWRVGVPPTWRTDPISL